MVSRHVNITAVRIDVVRLRTTTSCLLSKKRNPEYWGLRAWSMSGADWHQRLAPVAEETECLPDGQSGDG